MSLQIWLPLNGNLNNQGLSNLQFQLVNSTNTTINDNGKIGKCYNNNSNTAGGIVSTSKISLGQQHSMFCWFKFSSLMSNSSLGGTLVSTHYHSGNYGTGITIRYVSSTTGYLSVNTGNGSSRTYNTYYGTTLLQADTWYHGGFTYDGTNIKIYVNGKLEKTQSYTNMSMPENYIGLFIWSLNSQTPLNNYKLDGYLNDVRIYDHCLSQKEIEEISKGLILHYKLDDIYSEVTTMLSCNITETAYNSPISKYGYNDNSNLIKTVGNFQGKECVKIGTRTAGQQAQPYAYFGNLFTSDGTNAPAYKALSFDYYTTVPTTTWLNIYKLGSGEGTATWKTTNSDGIYSGTYTNSANAIIVKPNEWNHIEVVFHGTTSVNAEWGYCINGPTHTSNADYYFLYANIQLEQNDHVTGYGNNFHSSTIYDSSGYGNHGISISSPTSSNNTIRYKNSLLFDGTDDAIQFPYNQINPSGIFTVNLWFYKSELGSKNYETLFGGPSGFEMDTRSGSSTTLSLYMASVRGGNIFSPFALNTWYMITMVRDGINELYYVNGNLVKTIEAKSMPTGTYYIGAWNVSTSQNYKGNISDFRLYATVLTEEQIKELYNTSATIDNNGNIYSRDFIENDNLNITKTGLFQTSSIEDDDNGQASIFKTKKILGTNLYEY